jgi:hypothetical protein
MTPGVAPKQADVSARGPGGASSRWRPGAQMIGATCQVLVDAPVGDANAAMTVLHSRELTGALAEAAGLVALVAGQDTATAAESVRIQLGHAQSCDVVDRAW